MAVEFNGGVVIGADSRTTSGYVESVDSFFKQTIRPNSESKLEVKINLIEILSVTYKFIRDSTPT